MPTAPTSWASATRGSTACALASGSSTAWCSAACSSSAGVALCAIIVGTWIDRGFGALSEERLALLAATLLIVGIQIFFSSFLISILGLRRHS